MSETNGTGKDSRKEKSRLAREKREERFFQKYVPDETAKYMTEQQKQLLKEEILLAYRYKLPWRRRVYIDGLWHGIDLVEKYFAYSDEALVEQQIRDIDSRQQRPEEEKQDE